MPPYQRSQKQMEEEKPCVIDLQKMLRVLKRAGTVALIWHINAQTDHNVKYIYFKVYSRGSQIFTTIAPKKQHWLLAGDPPSQTNRMPQNMWRNIKWQHVAACHSWCRFQWKTWKSLCVFWQRCYSLYPTSLQPLPAVRRRHPLTTTTMISLTSFLYPPLQQAAKQ